MSLLTKRHNLFHVLWRSGGGEGRVREREEGKGEERERKKKEKKKKKKKRKEIVYKHGSRCVRTHGTIS